MARRAAGAAAAALFGAAEEVRTRMFSVTATSGLGRKAFWRIPRRQRSRAVEELQKGLADYLHTTRSLPFTYADCIARNSRQSLAKAVSEIPFTRSTYASFFQRFLRYNPINELEFFFESIGLSCREIAIPPSILPPEEMFLSDWKHFDVFRSAAAMGFPWNKLGLLCKDGFLICNVSPVELQGNIKDMKDKYGFDSRSVIGICLAFPSVLYGKMEKDRVLSNLKTLLLDSGMLNTVDGDVDSVFDICEKVEMFFNLSCEMEKLVELMVRSKGIFTEHSKEVLRSKISYFSNFGVQKDQVGFLLLSRPEIFSIDFGGNQIISVSGFLEHLGFTKGQVRSLKQKYPYVFGRNSLANFPSILRSMDLGQWFFERVKCGDLSLLGTYSISPMEDVDQKYMDNMSRIRGMRIYRRMLKKLSFMHSIGFGENRYAVRALYILTSNGDQLQQRFDCLLDFGIEFPKLCRLVSICPRILNHQKNHLVENLVFLCTEMGMPVDVLDDFPAYLCYSLEKRIKPRYEILKRLIEHGLAEQQYALSTVITRSDRTFFARLSRALKRCGSMACDPPTGQ